MYYASTITCFHMTWSDYGTGDVFQAIHMYCTLSGNRSFHPGSVSPQLKVVLPQLKVGLSQLKVNLPKVLFMQIME